MVVYADVLLFLNTIINYYIVSLTARLCIVDKKWYRYVISAFVGALFSLYIFLPFNNFLLELAVKLFCSAMVVLTAFGFENIAKFARRSLVFYVISFLYAGFMMALWFVFKPNGMIIHNSVVYFNISPALLIILSAVFYVVLTVLRRLLPKSPEKIGACKMELFCCGQEVEISAIVDTGHSVNDLFTDSHIIFISEKTAKKLFKETDPLFLNDKMKKRYRAIPCKTVDGTAVLDGFRCDEVIISLGEKRFKAKAPIAVISKHIKSSEYSALISPEILEESKEKTL